MLNLTAFDLTAAHTLAEWAEYHAAKDAAEQLPSIFQRDPVRGSWEDYDFGAEDRRGEI